MKKTFIEGKNIILISVKTQNEKESDVLDSLDELESLVKICGGEVVDKVVQNLEKSNFYHYVSSSKVEELKSSIKSLNCEVIIADEELTSLQLKTLRKTFGIKVIGRTRMALQVLYQRAQEEDTKLLIEMIRMKYYLPLVDDEEKDKIRQRMMVLHEHINEFYKKIELEKENRRNKKIPTICIVGYTNSGKTSLINKLSSQEYYVDGDLISTINPMMNKINLPSEKEAFIVDTIGFVGKLPYNLVKLVYSPLSHIEDADIIIHLIDISDKNYLKKQEIVNDTLDLMKIDKSRVIKVFNKCDVASEKAIKENEDNLIISIKENLNIDCLLNKIDEILRNRLKKFKVKIPYDKMNIVSILYEYAENLTEKRDKDGIILNGYIDEDRYNSIKNYRNIRKLSN